MKLYYIIICVLFLNCNKKQSNITTTYKEDNKPKKEKIIQDMHFQDVNFKDIMKLTKKEAIEKYGAPYKTNTDVLDNMQGEFYNSIQDAFINSNISPELIKIAEITWAKDSLNNITVWYQKTEESYIPKAQLIWEKGSEF